MTIEKVLAESRALHEAIVQILGDALPFPEKRYAIAMDACGVAFEHASAVRSLVDIGMPISATALLRVQLKALTRAMWLLYAATDADIDNLDGPLTQERGKAANKLPVAAEMLRALEKHGPAAAVRPLIQFKVMSAGPMNSFIHTGVHSLTRQREGFPQPLLDQIVRSSNGLNKVCAMLTAVLTGDVSLVARVKKIQALFLNVLPPLDDTEGY